ncbi:MAG: TonB-dependent receptor [Xanthomonadales bacterium]|jgi:iron complex outermembrane receptor protein|nr:TonB-dependent receptor [Xanthomonadales bacterium]
MNNEGMTTMQDFTARRSRLSAWVMMSLLMMPVAAVAQSDSEDQVDLGRLAVTGSRAKYRTVDDSPVPVDIIEAEDLVRTGQTELGRAIQALVPSFNFSSSSISDGTDALRPATLRGLGPDQTLVLINGKRRHTSALVHVNTSVGRGTAGTDLNAIPFAAIQRIEVLRDGAAAQYGSDAIAGVINLVLKDSATQRSASGQWGQTYDGDGETYTGNANAGFSLFNDGFLNLTYEYRDRQPTNRAGLDGTRQYACTDGVDFDPSCTNITTLDPREATFDRRSFRIGDADSEQHAVVANFGLPLGDIGEVYSFFTYSERDNESAGFTRRPVDTTRTVLEIHPDGFLPLINTDIEDISAFFGLRGVFGDNWSYDISGGYADNSFGFNISNSNNASLGAASPTSADAGELTFRQRTYNLDLSRPFYLDTAVVNLAFGAEYREEAYQITQGEPASFIDGGAINPLTGEAFDPGIQVFRGFSPDNAIDAERDSWATYIDLEAQLSDRLLITAAARYEDYSDFGDTLIGKGAFRFDVTRDLTLRGSVSSGFRAPSLAQQNFNSISTQFVSGPGGDLVLQQRGTFNSESEIAQTLGVPALQQEESENYTIGAVWKPTSELTFSADFYHINIDDRIVISGAISATDDGVPENIRNALVDQGIGAAQFFTNAASTETTGVELVATWDHVFDNGHSLELIAAGAYSDTDVDGDVNAPDLLSGLEDVLFTEQDRSIIEEWQPKSKVTVTGTYRMGDWTAVARLHRFGQYTIQEGNGDRQNFGSELVADLALSYEIPNTGLSFTVGANNINDQKPDRNRIGQSRAGSIPGIVDSDGVFTFSRRAAPFGFNGGYYYFRTNYRF